MKKVFVKLTNLALLTPIFAFGADTETDENALSEAVKQVGGQLSSSSTTAIGSGAKVVALIMFVLFFLFIIGGGIGAWFWYTRTRGNPQQPADTRIAGLMAIIGVVSGLIVWTIIYYLIKTQLGVDVVQIIKNSVSGS